MTGRYMWARPDIKGREEILRIHVRNKPLAEDVDLKVVAQSTPGFTGADLENVVNEGALLAAPAGATSSLPRAISRRR